MRIADIAMFLFIFQIMLATLNTIDIYNSGEMVNKEDVEKKIQEINNTVKDISGEINCGDAFWCQAWVAVKQFYATYVQPFQSVVETFGKSLLLGRFLAKLFEPIDPDGTLSKLFYIFDLVSVIVFVYGVAQFLRGVGFKVGR